MLNYPDEEVVYRSLLCLLHAFFSPFVPHAVGKSFKFSALHRLYLLHCPHPDLPESGCIKLLCSCVHSGLAIQHHSSGGDWSTKRCLSHCSKEKRGASGRRVGRRSRQQGKDGPDGLNCDTPGRYTLHCLFGGVTAWLCLPAAEHGEVFVSLLCTFPRMATWVYLVQRTVKCGVFIQTGLGRNAEKNVTVFARCSQRVTCSCPPSFYF